MHLSGDLFFKQVDNLTAQLQAFLDLPEGELKIDLGGVEAVDTAALQVIIAFLKSAAQRQKAVVFLHLSQPFRDALKTTGLDAFFETDESV